MENRLRHVQKRHNLDLRVVAPVPWFPFKSGIFGSYARYARAPLSETRHGIEVSHPRYMLPPKIGMTAAAYTLQWCFEAEMQRLIDDGWDFDLVDAHYYYPDGVAAARAAEKFGKPVVITARGTDINLIPQYRRQRDMILEASAIAAASISVCQALKDEMGEIGLAKEKIQVLRNGVDLTMFKPVDREATRQKLNLTGKTILSVGHLIERKGHHLIIEAMAAMQDVTLLVAGDGPDKAALLAQAESAGCADRVRFLGAVPHHDLAEIYSATDILVLASSREGWPNVLLEALACGTPCVVSPVWGNAEVITAPAAGVVCSARSPEAIADAVNRVFANPPDRAETRKFAERYSWDQTSDRVMQLYSETVENHADRPMARIASPDWSVERLCELPDISPSLLVTVDTEEIFDWDNSDYKTHKVAPPEDIARFQSVCDRNGIKPLYFITWPLMQDAASVAYFKTLHETGKADLGLHLHAWVTPPFEGEHTAVTSYQCNLSATLHRQKLRTLIDAFEKVFGFTPISHRAGRYGVSPTVHEHLVEAGIRYDFSPGAGFDLSHDGGPDFSATGNTPWWRKADNGNESLLCVPVTGGRSIKRTRKVISGSPTARALPLLLKKTTAPLRLSPENFELEDLKALTHAVRENETPLLVYSLHSTSLTPQATPYSQMETDIEKILDTTDSYLKWFNGDIGRPTDLHQLISDAKNA